MAGTIRQVMIPGFNHSHVLPPFVGERMTSAQSSPYPVTSTELAQRFAFNEARAIVLDGLLRYRTELRGLGFTQGFQWLDGSFVEDVEGRDNRPPKDIDVVTFAHPPAGMDVPDVRRIMASRPDLFDQAMCKRDFHCDTSIVNLATSPEWLVTQTRYWYGLYSHRRGDALWKGMLQLQLNSDDDQASAMLRALATEGDDHARST